MATSEVDVYERLNAMALPQEDRNAVVSFDELVSADTVAEIPNPYRVVENKDEYLNKPLYVREAVFKSPDASDYDGSYVILYCVSPDEMFILTDGGTGIYAYMKQAVNKRLDQGLADATQGFYFPNGLRKSEYDTITVGNETRPLNKGEKVPDGAKRGRGVTYYFA